MTRVIVTTKNLGIADRLSKSVANAIAAECSRTASQLATKSPKDLGTLAGGWGLERVRSNGLDVAIALRNDVRASFYRVAGRGPGKFPPFAQGTALAGWAARRGIAPFLVARAIAERGTQRWRDRDNVLGIDPVTRQYQSGSIVLATKARIVERIRQSI